jgi:hypothetical protein
MACIDLIREATKMKEHDGGISMCNQRSKLLCTIRNLLALSATLLVVSGGSALAQETADKDQMVEQPNPYLGL